MIAPAVGYVATLVVAMPWNDMAKVAGRSSVKGRRVKVPTVEQWRADCNWQNEITQVAKSPVARCARNHPAPGWRTGQSARLSRRQENEADPVIRPLRQN